jgi:transposase, IS30 family
MLSHFKHLNPSQRYQIASRLAMKQPIWVIASALGVHRSTVYREIARGGVGQPYVAKTAQQRAWARRAASAANHPTKPNKLWQYVRRQLKQEHSPDEISGRLRRVDGKHWGQVSGQAIYDWLKRTDSPLIDHLRHTHCRWHRKSSGGMPLNRPRIASRPDIVDARTRYGDYEGDTIQGNSRRQCIVTLVDRRSLYTHISQVLPKQAKSVARAIRQLLAQTGAKTLTLDNGTEFAAYAEIETALGIDVYFADPYHPEQRGRNEQQNKLIRQYIGKHANFDKLTPYQIRRAQDRLNHRPRKSLGYKTPHEVRFNLPPTPVAIRT